jgi:hypothetical protein
MISRINQSLLQDRINELRDKYKLPGGNKNRGRRVVAVTPAASLASGSASVSGMSVDDLVDGLSQWMISVACASQSAAPDITEIETHASGNAGDAFGGHAEAARCRTGA